MKMEEKILKQLEIIEKSTFFPKILQKKYFYKNLFLNEYLK